jgi:hypothetical protein
MIRPQSVGLHVTYDERCNGGHIFNAVRELLQDVSRCLRVRGTVIRIAEVRQNRSIRTAFQILAGKRGFDVGYGERLKTCKNIASRSLR